MGACKYGVVGVEIEERGDVIPISTPSNSTAAFIEARFVSAAAIFCRRESALKFSRESDRRR